MPCQGLWSADLLIDADAAPSGGVALVIGATQLLGTVVRSGSFVGRIHARVVAGGGGMGTVLDPKAYQGVPVRIPLQDLLAASGETLAQTTDAAFLAFVLPKWTTLRMKAGEVLEALIAATGLDLTWRALADGTIWIGRDTWVEDKRDLVTITARPGHASIEIATEEPTVFPGTSLGGRHVNYVEHTFTASRIRSKVWFEL